MEISKELVLENPTTTASPPGSVRIRYGVSFSPARS
jgi:hypothetical protein